MKKRYRIVNQKRFFVFVTMILAIIILASFSILFKDKVHSSVHQVQYYEIEVKEGDTLCHIARKHLPEKIDIRKTIYEIQNLNGIDSGYIFPGDIIKIPIENK